MPDNYFENRISCRNFKERKISDQRILQILEKAMRAPTCGNMQLYSVIITKEKDNLVKLSQLHYNQPAATTAPVILTICADFNRFTRWCKLKNADDAFNNLHSFLTAMTDAVILSQQIVTIAEMEGFGTCYLGTVIYNAKEISDFLKLPELVIPVASVSIGEKESKEEKVERLKVEDIIHKESYKHLTDSEILEIFKIKEDFEPNKKYIEESGKENLAQVFSEIRYPRLMNEKLSETFLSLIKEKGFLK